MKECNQHSLNKFRYGIYTSDFGHLLYGCMACPMIAQKGASGDKELVEFARIDFDSRSVRDFLIGQPFPIREQNPKLNKPMASSECCEETCLKYICFWEFKATYSVVSGRSGSLH